jgi:N-acetylmuramoyl-L-alanine amidase
MRPDHIRASMSDYVAVVATLYGEARNEPIHAIIAVACVIRNRVKADLGGDQKKDWFGEGYREVCVHPWQFSCFWEDNSNTDAVYALAQRLMVDGAHPANEVALIADLQWVADGIISDRWKDITKGSMHYVTSAMFRKAPPKWARGRAPTVEIGSHVFFAGVS